MLIILEGPECGGKSTLAQRLVDELKRADPDARVDLLHRSRPRSHPVDEYVAPLLDYRPGRAWHVVCDRWHVGEVVYPPLVDRPTYQSPAVTTYVEQFLRSRAALLVHCTAGTRYLTDCNEARGFSPAELELVPRVIAGFQNATVRSLLETVTVDATDSEADYYDDVVAEVLHLASDRDAFEDDLSSLTTYVGPPRPRLLLVGDRRGTPTHDLASFGRWPAFVPRPGTSGLFLMETLTTRPLSVPTDGLTLRDVGLVNACDVDDPLYAWTALDKPHVVALGHNAARRLRDVGVPFRFAYHPQFFRRFRHHGRADYLTQLLPNLAEETA